MEQIENGLSTNWLLSIKLSLVFTHFTRAGLLLLFNRSSVERQPKVNAKLMFKIILQLWELILLKVKLSQSTLKGKILRLFIAFVSYLTRLTAHNGQTG